MLRFDILAVPDAKSYLFHLSQPFEQKPDGTLYIRFCAGGMLEIAWELMAWQEDVTIIAPDPLKYVMKKELTKLYRHYANSTHHKRFPSKTDTMC